MRLGRREDRDTTDLMQDTQQWDGLEAPRARKPVVVIIYVGLQGDADDWTMPEDSGDSSAAVGSCH